MRRGRVGLVGVGRIGIGGVGMGGVRVVVGLCGMVVVCVVSSGVALVAPWVVNP